MRINAFYQFAPTFQIPNPFQISPGKLKFVTRGKIFCNKPLEISTNIPKSEISTLKRELTMRNSKLFKISVCAYRTLIKWANLIQPLILVLFRFTWGVALYNTGRGKLLNHQHVVSFFTGLGIPLPEFNAWFVAGLEYTGGILLVIGLCSRPVALMMAVNMFVAYISVAEDRAALLNVFTDYTAFIEADPFFFLLMSVLILAFGPGLISIDAVLKNRFCTQCDSSSANQSCAHQ